VKLQLVPKLEGDSRRPKGQVPLGPEGGPPDVYGIDLDGEHYQLDGQPPVATTKGWGKVPGTPN